MGIFERVDPMLGGRVIGESRKAIWSTVNYAPFVFQHSLANHPLFEAERLLELAVRALERGERIRSWFRIEGDEEFEGAPSRDKLARAIKGVEDGKVWFKLSAVEKLDPAYDHLLKKVIGEIEELSGLPIRHEMKFSQMTAFVASPNMVTPYHIDHDTNFLFQIRGMKEVRLFDPENRSVLSIDEIERFYGGNSLAATYREEISNLGTLFHLTPGLAVHHPPLAPHLVKAGSEVSVGVAMFFTTARDLYRARVYQANYCLRRMGLRPAAPGASRLRDELKYWAFARLAKSDPANWDELMYSGMHRLKAPARLALRTFKSAERALRIAIRGGPH